MRAFVLGGRGFIGRHVVAALAHDGWDVVVGSRVAESLGAERAVAVRRARFEQLTEISAWAPLLAGMDVVVNCVGILRERRGESYDAVHHRAPSALADACVAAGIARLVHVSALGLATTARDGFLVSKLAGERALPRPLLDVTIVRPSLLDGDGGFGARWLRRLARLPVHVVPASANGRIAALDVDDLGVAIARLCAAPAGAGLHEVELGGSDARTLAEHLQALRRMHTSRPAWTVRAPHAAAALAARCCDVLHFSPFSVGHLELLSRDNVPRTNRLAALLGRAPRRIGIPSPAEMPADLAGTPAPDAT